MDPTRNQQSDTRKKFLYEKGLPARDVAAYTLALQQLATALFDQQQAKILSFLHTWAPELKDIPPEKLAEHLQHEGAALIGCNHDYDPITNWSNVTWLFLWPKKDIRRALLMRTRTIGEGAQKDFSLASGEKMVAHQHMRLEVEAGEIPVPDTVKIKQPKKEAA